MIRTPIQTTKTHATHSTTRPVAKAKAHHAETEQTETFSPSSKPASQPKGLYAAHEVTSDEPKAKETVRADVRSQIEALKDMPISGIKATTRGIPRLETFIPEAPTTISAQRYQFDFQGPDGTVGLIVNTEAGISHCQPVVPGETAIPGASISFLSDASNSSSTEGSLNRAETKCLLETLYGRFNQPMSQVQADRANMLNSAVFAVWGKDGGQASAIQSAHGQMAAALKPDQGNDGGWNLRG